MKKTKGLNRKAILLTLGIVMSLAVAVVISFWPAASPVHPQDQPLQISGPFYSTAIKFDVSPPLRTMTPMVQTTCTKADDDVDEDGQSRAIYRSGRDRIAQDKVGLGIFSSEIPSPIVSFEGIANMCGCQPPDTDGDVGPNHYVQMVNLHFQIFNKSGTTLFGPATINTLFAGFGGACQTDNAGDPVVLYDQLADRWLLSQFTTSVNSNCVAISQTSDPTGAYYRYQFSAPAFPDYPKYGIWPDAYYINTNEGANVGNYALDRNAMLAGNPTPGMVRFGIAQPVSGSVSGMLPADVEGTSSPQPAHRRSLSAREITTRALQLMH